MAIPINDRLVRPMEDQYMIYNYDINFYQLTLDGAYEVGIDLPLLWRTVDNAEKYLELLSNAMKNVILGNKKPEYKDYFLYMYAHSKKYRKAIKTILQDSLQYNKSSGGFMVSYQTGINLNEMKEIRLDEDRLHSVIGGIIGRTTGLFKTFLDYNLNDMEVFEDLEELLSYMVSKSLITQEKADKIKHLKQVPRSNLYIIYENEYNNIVFEDLKTKNRILETKGVDW